MVKKYKVTYDRNMCIGAAACNTSNPEGFEIDKEDGLANLTDGKKTDKHEVYELVISEEQFKKFKDAEEVCPVNGCIKVEELEE